MTCTFHGVQLKITFGPTGKSITRMACFAFLNFHAFGVRYLFSINHCMMAFFTFK